MRSEFGIEYKAVYRCKSYDGFSGAKDTRFNIAALIVRSLLGRRRRVPANVVGFIRDIGEFMTFIQPGVLRTDADLSIVDEH